LKKYEKIVREKKVWGKTVQGEKIQEKSIGIKKYGKKVRRGGTGKITEIKSTGKWYGEKNSMREKKKKKKKRKIKIKKKINKKIEKLYGKKVLETRLLMRAPEGTPSGSRGHVYYGTTTIVRKSGKYPRMRTVSLLVAPPHSI
jgi:hypothetical protein